MIGAGVAGLACAASLSRAGMRVLVLEARRCAGGRARSWPDARTGMHVDIGPHVVSTEHRQFLRLLRDNGTQDDICWQPEPLIELHDAQGTLRVPTAAWTPPLHGLPMLPAALRRLGVRDLLSHLRVGWQAARTNERELRIAGDRVLGVAPWDAAALLARTDAPVVRGLQQQARSFLGAPYTSTILWFDRRVTDRRFWARVWDPGGLDTDFYDLAAIRPALAGGGSVIASNAIGPQAHFGWSDAHVVARTRLELETAFPVAREARLLHARVHRIRAAIPQPRPGSETLRPTNRTAVGGLLLAGDWTATAVPCSMESAARSAALACDAVLGAGHALPPPETYGLVGLLRRKS